MELTALIFSVLAFVFSILNFIELRAQAKSTHQIQYIDPLKDWGKEPLEASLQKLDKEEKELNELDNIF